MKKTMITVILLVLLLTLVGCTPNNGTYTLDNPAGFWWGLWHGGCSGINLIRSLFNNKVGIYEVVNNGGWYNFGFLWGVGLIGGGASSSAKNKRRR